MLACLWWRWYPGGASHVEVLKPEAYDAMTNPGEVLTLADTEGDAFSAELSIAVAGAGCRFAGGV